VWVLAFDAEDELSVARGYTPSRAMQERNARLTRLFAAGLPKGDLVVDLEGQLHRGWCGRREGPLDLREPTPAEVGESDDEYDDDEYDDDEYDDDEYDDDDDEYDDDEYDDDDDCDADDADGADDEVDADDADGADDDVRERKLLPRVEPRAWCPTPRSLAAFRLARYAAPMAPSAEVLRRANGRAFAHALAPDELPGAASLATRDDVLAHLARPSPTGGWLLKRELGMAGRGQRPIEPGRLDDGDRAFIVASLRRGPLQIEPRVDLLRELTIHAWIVGERVVVTSVREQILVERAWVTSRVVPLPAELERAVVDATERAGRALVQLGYFGPFGVDAYEWRTPSGTTALRAIGEINARFCMDWDARDGWDPPR
jgi:hypothetical protein